MIDDINAYHGLEATEPKTFPKQCNKCGHTYPSLQAFIEGTGRVADCSGLKQYNIGKMMIVLFRNCECDSTLMVNCQNRRDDSPVGILRRESFASLMSRLIKAGVDTKTAKEELIKIVHGEASPIVARHNISPNDLKIAPA